MLCTLVALDIKISEHPGSRVPSANVTTVPTKQTVSDFSGKETRGFTDIPPAVANTQTGIAQNLLVSVFLLFSSLFAHFYYVPNPLSFIALRSSVPCFASN